MQDSSPECRTVHRNAGLDTENEGQLTAMQDWLASELEQVRLGTDVPKHRCCRELTPFEFADVGDEVEESFG